MMRRYLIFIVSFIATLGVAILQAQQDSTARNKDLPPGEKDARSVLDSSPRHGEWVTIPYNGGKTQIQTWIVYPERKDKAPVILLIHEIYGARERVTDFFGHKAIATART